MLRAEMAANKALQAKEDGKGDKSANPSSKKVKDTADGGCRRSSSSCSCISSVGGATPNGTGAPYTRGLRLVDS